MSGMPPVQHRKVSFLAGRSIAIALAATMAFCVSGCSLIPGRITSMEATPSLAPTVPDPREPLGPRVDVGRVELPAAGFSVTVPDGWTVEVADPERDITGAAPGTVWEALRAQAEDGQATCSAYVVAAPAGHAIDEAVSPLESAASITEPEWREGPEGMQLLLPTPSLAGSLPGRGAANARWRLPDSDSALDGGILYAVDCWWVRGHGGEAARFLESMVLLEPDSTEP